MADLTAHTSSIIKNLEGDKKYHCHFVLFPHLSLNQSM